MREAAACEETCRVLGTNAVGGGVYACGRGPIARIPLLFFLFPSSE
jgi:hypothetical protein